MKTIQFNFTQNNFPSTQLELNNNYKVACLSHYSSQSQIPTLLTLLEKPLIYSGYINGYHQPVGQAKLHVISFSRSQMQSLQQALEYYFNSHSIHFTPIQSEIDLIACLGEGVCAIQKAAGFPIFEPIKIEVISEENKTFTLWMPILHEENCFHHAMAFMLQFITHHIADQAFTPNPILSNEINELINQLKIHAPNGVNSLRLLETAHHENIPWLHIAQNVFQYGYGRHSRWFDSTFTDTTSHLAAGLARNKHSTSKLLLKAGLPVPKQIITQSESDAVESAKKMGYPVVIKPHNQDGGKGVFARLMSDHQVRMAYQHARKYSDNVLLEKHIIGKDYRLLVLNGELIWAIERIPAGVTGDGSSNINELIQNENRLPERMNNNDTHEFLADQGYDFNSILAPGQFVPLSRIANVSTGGTPVAVFDKVHPDNKRLVETAANLLRLNLAGIDFITPDIQQSYLVTGGAIIEVNAQPQLGMITAAHMYKHILSTLVPNQGRIPIIVICSHSSEDLFIHTIHSLLSNQYKNIGLAKDNNAYMNHEQLSQGNSLFSAAETLLLNTQVDALIYCMNDLDDIKFQGLPFDHYDYLIFLDAPLSKNNMTREVERCLIHTLFNACHGEPLVNENALDYLTQFNITQKTVLTKDKILHEIENPNSHYWRRTRGSTLI